MKKVFTVLFFLWITPAMASDIQFDRTMTQQMFKDFSQEAGAVVLYRAIGPAEPLGLIGFDIGVETTATKINENKDYWKKSVSDQNPSAYLVSPPRHPRTGRNDFPSIATDKKSMRSRAVAIPPTVSLMVG